MVDKGVIGGDTELEPMRLLVVNAGSSSLKLRVLGCDDQLLKTADLPAPSAQAMSEALEGFLAEAPSVDAAGHRVVHGGREFPGPIRIDEAADARLEQLSALAPLHNPPALAGIRALRRLRPGLTQVACFDTSFHASLLAPASTYAIPRLWTKRWGLRRYGFHGLSHAWASRRAAALIGRPAAELRLVTAHLGSGASLAAVAGGRSVDTTMGFTPLEGLVMGTRSGSVDPGLIVWLQRHGGLSAAEVERGLAYEGGLFGLCGASDLRAVLAAADAGEADARLAYAVYVHRLRAQIAGMAAAMGGMDGLVFTGGAGEGSARLRRDACAGLGFLGVVVDDAANEREASCDRLVCTPESPAAVAVVASREDLEIARQVRQLLH
jgi:acetate kinase